VPCYFFVQKSLKLKLFCFCRSQFLFIEDVTDAYFLTLIIDMMDMEDIISKPKDRLVLSLMSEEQKCQWLNNMSKIYFDILNIITEYR
jgi:hypothetical protein